MRSSNKIAIMTWYRYQNYGSALQASAIYHKIRLFGYSVDLINYPPKGNVVDKRTVNLGQLFKKSVAKICGISKNNAAYTSEQLNNLYQEFLNERITETKVCKTFSELSDLASQYNAIVCGSDQIWSPLCFDDKYFLSFVEDPNKMIAYAPSLGSEEIKNAVVREKMSALISRFPHLSVREQQNSSLIKELTGKDAEVVLDPTFLLRAKEWDVFADVERAKKLQSQNYILCYFLGQSQKYMGFVRDFSKKSGLPFYVIPITNAQKKQSCAVPFEVGPGEFVSLIANASFVITDSFHGMAFAVNYNIPFTVFKRFADNDPKNQNTRIFHLLKLLNLEDRLSDYRKKADAAHLLTCDFSDANCRLAEQRSRSESYLSSALASAVNAAPFCVKDRTVEYRITRDCCGCGACANVCPKDAITITQDNLGFEHYKVEADKCVRCGKCRTVCPFFSVDAAELSGAVSLFAVKSRAEQVLQKSSSGGIGHELARLCMNKGYTVCGCTYDSEKNLAKHILIKPGEEEKLPLLQGSKYIQSISAPAFRQIVELSENGKIIFFGTPCQTAGLDKLLRSNNCRDHVILVDLICHGVPSYSLWDKYLKERNQKNHVGTHPQVTFRSQDKGWRRMLISLSGNGHVYRKEESKDDFYAFFRRGLCYMDSCFECPYRERSAADIRIGDYWGSRFDKDQTGVSMVLANTQNGLKLIHELSESGFCKIEEYPLSEYWTVQYPYNAVKPIYRDDLIRKLKDDSIYLSDLRREYCQYYDTMESVQKILRKVKKALKR